MNVVWYVRWRVDMLLHWRCIQALLPRSGAMAEIGTWRGASARRWQRQGPRLLVLVDEYRAKMDASWEGRVSQGYIERVRRAAMLRVKGNEVRWLRLESTQAARRLASGTLDLVYIDGDHDFQPVWQDLNAWWPKVKPGGCMVLDDHITGRWWGESVIRAAAAFEPSDEAHRRRRGRWLVITKEAA